MSWFSIDIGRGFLLHFHPFSAIHFTLIFSHFLFSLAAKLIWFKNSTAPGQTLDSLFSFLIFPQSRSVLINFCYINFLFFAFSFPKFRCLSGGLGYLIVPK